MYIYIHFYKETHTYIYICIYTHVYICIYMHTFFVFAISNRKTNTSELLLIKYIKITKHNHINTKNFAILIYFILVLVFLQI